VFGYHTLHREQRLRGTPGEVFPFFADAGNLEAITPPWLGFAVVTHGLASGSPPASPPPIQMRPGTIIEYRLRLHGLPLRWLTQIADWAPGERFVDVQLRGPYALWHHTHEFAPAPGGGTIMRDTVRYALPLAPLSGIAHAAFVRRDLDRIFAFRAAEVARRLDG
jgi:ligand-binding SRPBCC domain-containing protein